MARRVLAASIGLALLAGCAGVRVESTRPEVELPAAWGALPGDAAPITSSSWWQLYADPMLDRLVEESLAHNADLAVAVARVDEARALVAMADADRRPFIDATAQADRSRTSWRNDGQQSSGNSTERNNLRGTINIAYEIDLWGRLRTASEAARADLLATEAARNTVEIALGAEVARAYFNLRALDAQIETTRRTLALREQTLALQRKRLAAGVITELDLRQVEAELAAARALLPPLELSLAREEAALALLLGRSPRAITEDPVQRSRADAVTLTVPVVPAGLPSELLLRRPDIVEAEQRLAATNARVAIARVSHFPSLALTGFLGLESAALSNLLSGSALIWQAATALAIPLYAGGRLEAQIDASRARERQAIAHYQQTIRAAFAEVRTALVAQQQARASFDAEEARIRALNEALRLARLRYEGGLASQLEVLDAERAQLGAELSRIDAARAQRVAVADLIRALGGGWE